MAADPTGRPDGRGLTAALLAGLLLLGCEGEKRKMFDGLGFQPRRVEHVQVGPMPLKDQEPPPICTLEKGASDSGCDHRPSWDLLSCTYSDGKRRRTLTQRFFVADKGFGHCEEQFDVWAWKDPRWGGTAFITGSMFFSDPTTTSTTTTLTTTTISSVSFWLRPEFDAHAR